MVIGAVASTLSVPSQPGMSTLDSIVEWLRGRRLLLILDNCEHLLTAVADLVVALITHQRPVGGARTDPRRRSRAAGFRISRTRTSR
jgi:predicted ATPase